MSQSESVAPDVANYLAKERQIVEKLPIPSREHIPPKIMTIAEAIGNISGSWNPVEIYTPSVVSVAQEKKRFLDAFDEGSEYNPSFEYPNAAKFDPISNREALTEKLHELRQLEFKKEDKVARLARAALYFKIKDDLATCDLSEGIQEKDEEKIAKAMKQKYPGVDDALLEHATDIFNNLVDKSQGGEEPEATVIKPPLSKEEKDYLERTKVDSEGIKEAFEWTLDQYGMLRTDDSERLGFKVVVSSEATGIDVRDKSIEGPTVFIPESRRISLSKLLSLMAHEIEGHARQSVNGQELFYLGGGPLKIDNEMLYEGLGMRYETQIRKGLLGEVEATPLPYYTFAIAKAETGSSFYEIFSEIMNLRLRVRLGKPPGEPILGTEKGYEEKRKKAMNGAWTTTYRVMRGHIDTSNPEGYAMAKDLSYLRGWLIDRQLGENGLGFLNDAAIVASGGLQFLAELDLSEKDLPLPFKDMTTKYWEEVLKPEMETA